jgi:hypothetical protein
VIKPLTTPQISARLLKERREAYTQSLPKDLQAFSERRLVSLVQLEAECARRLQAGEPLTDELRFLAGLQRIDYLFVDAAAEDLLLAGPAEGFAPDGQGRMLGLTTGQPTLRLEDLVVALQGAASGVTSIGCSIDPRPERLSQLGEFLRRNSTAAPAATVARRFDQMAAILGNEVVTVFGVPADSHFGVTLVEADLRMKRISLGVEPSGVKGIRSHLSLLTPNGNSIQRWWFTPLYDAIYASEDRTAYQLAGQRVQLLAQEELADASGQRSNAPFTRLSTQQFARLFTAGFPELAERTAVFAELRNLFDLAVIAALIRKEGLLERIDWEPGVFVDPASGLVQKLPVPKEVAAMSTFRKGARGVILGLVGGVTIDPRSVTADINTQAETASQLAGIRRGALATHASAGSWWSN